MNIQTKLKRIEEQVGLGGQLSTMIEFQRKGLEGQEIMARLTAIEEKLGIKEGTR